MEYINNDELTGISGGGFAYDVGCVIGFIIRYASVPISPACGYVYATAVWEHQHSQ